MESWQCRHLMISKALLNFRAKYRKWLPPTSPGSSYGVFVAFSKSKLFIFENDQYQPCGWFCHSFHT